VYESYYRRLIRYRDAVFWKFPDTAGPELSGPEWWDADPAGVGQKLVPDCLLLLRETQVALHVKARVIEARPDPST
jgi:hypothetical protein